jgi:S-methylmethionine-dependent homocysteine/selenocysteine methylase
MPETPRRSGEPHSPATRRARIRDANLGYNPTGPVFDRPILGNRRPSTGPDIIQAADYYPSRIAGFAADWLDAGAQIVGGCCASGPEHIAAIRRVVSTA